LFITLIFLSSFVSYFISSNNFIGYGNYNTQNQDIKISQGMNNHSVNYIFPKIIWIECQVEITIKSNQSGEINIFMDDFGSNDTFDAINQNFTLVGYNQSQTFIIKTQAKLSTFPGKYNFILSISGLFYEIVLFESILVMGYILMFLFIGVIGIPFTIILIKKFKTKEDVSKKPIPHTKSYETIEGLTAKKIMCPKCQEIIPEGLSLCPECGDRIPEFLRYSSPTS